MFQSFTDVFANVYNIKASLAETGLRLTSNQIFVYLLIKEYMFAERKISVTKKEIYNEAEIYNRLGFSRSTFGRIFNALVKEKCLLPAGLRGNNSKPFGISEAYRLSMMSKRIDSILSG